MVKVQGSCPQHVRIFAAENVAVSFGWVASSASLKEKVIMSIGSFNQQSWTGFYPSLSGIATVYSISHCVCFYLDILSLYPIL